MRLIDKDKLWEALALRTKAYAEKSYDHYNYSVSADVVAAAEEVDAIPVKPLAQWLAGYAAPPAYALDAVKEGGFLSPEHQTKAWEHHLHTLMENGLMEEEDDDAESGMNVAEECAGCSHWDGDDGRCRNHESEHFMAVTDDGCEMKEEDDGTSNL